MLQNFQKVTNFNADSVIEEKVVIRMRATINEDGSINYGKTVKNVESYMSNQEQCDSDFEEFETEVLKMAQL